VIKDELESLERYTKELEALRNYTQVKGERDSLVEETAGLKDKVVQLQAHLESEVSLKKEFSSQLSNSQDEVRELSMRLDEARKELSSLQDFKVKLPEGAVLGLDEMKTRFLEAEEDEIEKKAKARLTELEKELRSQMPALVRKKLAEVLKLPTWPSEIERLIDSRARQIADERLRDKEQWPDWFQEHYLNEVKELVSKELDSEFENRVEAESEKRFGAMKSGEWNKYTIDKARELAVDLKGLVRELQGTWWFSCDRCNRRLALEIGPPEIGVLLGGGVVEMVCTVCTETATFPFVLSTIPHKVSSLTLGGLIQAYIGEAP